jgi:xylose isomerase
MTEQQYFDGIEPIGYEGPETDEPLAFRWYDADRVVLGRTMRDHLRFAVCYWHSFNWDGFDIFGDGTLDRPWLSPAGDPVEAAEQKMAVAFVLPCSDCSSPSSPERRLQ